MGLNVVFFYGVCCEGNPLCHRSWCFHLHGRRQYTSFLVSFGFHSRFALALGKPVLRVLCDSDVWNGFAESPD